jgi:hypothetical protein
MNDGGEAGNDTGSETAGTAGTDSQTEGCPGTFEETTSALLTVPDGDVGGALSVGGYLFTNEGESGNGITVEIGCSADGEMIANGIPVVESGTAAIIDIHVDGKRIMLENHSNNATTANMTISVQNL